MMLSLFSVDTNKWNVTGTFPHIHTNTLESSLHTEAASHQNKMSFSHYHVTLATMFNRTQPGKSSAITDNRRHRLEISLSFGERGFPLWERKLETHIKSVFFVLFCQADVYLYHTSLVNSNFIKFFLIKYIVYCFLIISFIPYYTILFIQLDSWK